MSNAPRKCPMCGEKKQWKKIETAKKGFSGGKAAAGLLLFGPIGALAGGGMGNKTETWACGKCGFQHEYH